MTTKPITTQERLDEAQREYDAAKAEESRAIEAANFAGSHRQRVASKLEIAKQVHAASIPVDRSQRTLSDGSPVTEDHREINPATGQQKGYVALSQAERSKGFVRPLRDAYRHAKCGKVTTVNSRALVETYARDPYFYSGTFCTTCGGHFPVGEDGEFVWLENDGREVEKVGT